MKKIIALLCVSLVFYGCSLSDTFKDDPEFTAVTGVLTSQKANDDYAGTHLLTDEEGKVTAVRSLSINLDSKEYLNNEVEALGVLNESDAVFEITGVSVVEVLSDEKDVGKKTTYKNTEFGFQFEYYDSWEVQELGNEVLFTSPVDEEKKIVGSEVSIEQIVFDYQPKTAEDGTSDTPLVAYFQQNGETDVSKDINKVGVDQLDAVVRELSSGQLVYTLYRSGLVYEITYTPGDAKDLDVKNVFLEMMSSFRFIGFEVEDENQEGTTDSEESEAVAPVSDLEFTSFESLPYSFAGKYPKSWYYAGKSATSSGVLHHYGFSEESVTDDNELISLDVVSTSKQVGEKKTINGKELYISSSGDEYSVYLTLDGQNYEFHGDIDHKDLILTMALGLSTVKTEEEDL